MSLYSNCRKVLCWTYRTGIMYMSQFINWTLKCVQIVNGNLDTIIKEF
jgi:hypothetical protein